MYVWFACRNEDFYIEILVFSLSFFVMCAYILVRFSVMRINLYRIFEILGRVKINIQVTGPRKMQQNFYKPV